MMCEECGMREASVRVTMLIGGEKKERLLCKECVAKHQLLRFDLGDLVKRLIPKNNKADLETEEDVPEIICSQCGTTYAEFKKTGLLGCPACYSEFREQLTQQLSVLQGETRHTGQTPEQPNEQVSLHMQLDRLRQQMALAVDQEEYETAAKLRDEIRDLTARLKEDVHDE